MQTVQWAYEASRALLEMSTQATNCNICFCPATVSEAELCCGLVYLVEHLIKQCSIQAVCSTELWLTALARSTEMERKHKNVCNLVRGYVSRFETLKWTEQRDCAVRKTSAIKDQSYDLEPVRWLSG